MPVQIVNPPADTVICVSDVPLSLVVEGVADSLGQWLLEGQPTTLPLAVDVPGVYHVRFETGVGGVPDDGRTAD